MLVSADFDLAAVRHAIAEAKGHTKVRRLEQQECVAALEDGHAVWLVSDWGMGRDGFISAICGQTGVSRDRVFVIDFADFGLKGSFFDDLRTRLGATFQQVCEAIAEAGSCVLVLDDLDVSASTSTAAGEIEALVRPICDFAPDARIVIRARRRPRGVALPVVELKALDEPDVATYARESELGGERYAKPDAVSSLFRHTDGIPARIDDALRDLEIVSIGDLLAADPDYADAATPITTAPPALVAAVSGLARSEDRAEERAYNLLLALATLPQGEQLTRLTRFLGPHPFFTSHARALLERSLIDTVTITTLEGMPGDGTQKALVVPRPVREYVRSAMDDATARSFDRRALDLYFGDEWTTGQIRTSPTSRRVRNALCDGYEIQNASALIIRAARRGVLDEAELEVEAAIRLGSAFIEVLITGDHHRAAAALSEDMIRLLEQSGGHAREINVLRYELARSYRMTGRLPEAQAAFERLEHSLLSKDQRQISEVGLALALKGLGEQGRAIEAASRAIAIDKRSNAALQARTIIAEGIEDPARRMAELKSLLVTARKAKSTTITNNILLTMSRLEKDDDAAVALIKEVVTTRPGKEDFYNSARAIVDLASHRSNKQGLGESDRSRLIDAYHFLYSERLAGLFDRCHAVLWREFERSGEIGNLLNLFRHSSFIWRLSSREDLETKYLNKLAGMMRELLVNDTVRSSRDGAYFVVRVSIVMKDRDLSLLA